jgi:hypothetical protein
LQSDVKDFVAKVILYGSHAKGKAEDDSDIDILVVTSDGEAGNKAMMDRAYDFMVEHGVLFEVLTASLHQILFPQNYFPTGGIFGRAVPQNEKLRHAAHR